MASSYETSLPITVEQTFPPAPEALRPRAHDQLELLQPSAALGVSRDCAYIRQFLLTSLPLWLGDQLALCISLFASSFVVAALHAEVAIDWAAWLTGLSIATTLTFGLLGLYPAVGISADSELRLATLSSLLVFVGAAVAHAFWIGTEPVSSLLMAYSGIVCIVLTPTLRRQIRRLAGRTSWWAQPILVFGGGESGLRVFRSLIKAPQSGLRPIGIVDELHRHWGDELADPAWYLGPWSDAGEIIESRQVFRGVVPLEAGGELDLGRRLTQLGGTLPHLVVTFDAWSPLSQHTAGDCPLIGIPALQIDQKLLLPLSKWMKIALDATLVVCVGAVAFPLIAVLATIIFLSSGRPIFFSHERVGIGGRRFRMWKFRSMVTNAETVLQEHLKRDPILRAEWHKYHKLRHDPRVTWIGRLLRKTSLDELPQIWNIACGDMSFVGPRPYPLYEHDDMSRTAPVIMRVRPGITGMWQVTGRAHSTFEKRMKIDAAYVRDWSPWLDLCILARTFGVVVRGDGAY